MRIERPIASASLYPNIPPRRSGRDGPSRVFVTMASSDEVTTAAVAVREIRLLRR